MSDLVGTQVGHYLVQGHLGGGGMGVVYAATDTRLDRRVALKVLPDEIGPDAIERFSREARAASSLSHPNICVVYDIGVHEERPFLVMELLEGRTLKQVIGDGPMALDALLDLSLQLLAGLGCAHEAGILHRDLKPANLFLTNHGHVKILDFGLAKLLGGRGVADDVSTVPTSAGTELTVAGTTLGTLGYMAPEQLLGRALDRRADLFAIGAVVYELAGGRKAFIGDTNGAVMDAILHHNPEALSSVGRNIPDDLSRIVAKAMEKDPELRYQSAAALRSDLLRLKRDSAVGDSAPSFIGDSYRSASPRRSLGSRIAIGVAGVVAVVAVTMALGWWPQAEVAGETKARSVVTSIAVLPPIELGSDENQNLGLAVADELTTTLSRVNGLSVRPLSMTLGYREPGQNLRVIGKELGVSFLVTGHIIRGEQGARVSLEAVDAGTAVVIWRETLELEGGDLLDIANLLQNSVGPRLLKSLGLQSSQVRATTPANQEAFELYLESLSGSSDNDENDHCIELLEKAVELDPSFAPAWGHLGHRYYWRAFGDTEGDDLERAVEAVDRCLQLDPGFEYGRMIRSVMRVEAGELVEALVSARDYASLNPDKASAHFSFSYALRYAGFQQMALEECRVAIELDPNDSGLRSCGFNALFLGRLDEAKRFFSLDIGTGWVNTGMIRIAVRKGDFDEVARLGGRTDGESFLRGFLLAQIDESSSDEDRKASAERLFENSMSNFDPEARFLDAGDLIGFGHRELGVELLESAIANHYCVGEALTNDPQLKSLAGSEDLERLRAASDECQRPLLEIIAG